MTDEPEKDKDEYETSSQSSLEQSSADKSLEQSSADKDEESEEGENEGLRYAPWIGVGFGLVVSGYLSRYFLQIFKSMKMSISPSVGNIFITIGIIVLIVALTAEIFTAIKKGE